MNILGVNSVYHESAACLVQDGRIVAAAEEERFNRIKHGKPASITNPHHLPVRAIRYCLEAAALTFKDIQHVGFSFQPADRLKNIGVEACATSEGWGSPTGEERFHRLLETIPGRLQAELGMPAETRFHWLKHHLCHAASAYLVSPFDDAAVLTVDGIGEFSTVLIAHGRGNQIIPLRAIDYPNSLGFLWEKLCCFLGFDEYDGCKVMGLAAYGDAGHYAKEFAQLVQITATGFRVNGERLAFRQPGQFAGLEALLGTRRNPGAPLEQRHKDIAAALQLATERIMLELAFQAKRATGSASLCLAGGVALNCAANQVLQEQGPFANLFIQPAAHDAGTALGAACWLWQQENSLPRICAMQTAYLGPAFSEVEMENALRESGLDFRRSPDVAGETARLLQAGHVIGWFQGRMEFGPRALGNRSVLADPRDPHTRDKLNDKIKHREAFRPFGPSVTEEAAPDWFVLPRKASRPAPAEFMLCTYKIAAGRAPQIPAVAHCDQTSRIQIVRQAANPRFHELLTRFGELTGVPMLLNTSFNDSEPIVCSPRDAIQTFCNTYMDFLVLGEYLAQRKVAA